jgi:hypothetical protein
MNKENFEKALYLGIAVLLIFLSEAGLGRFGLGHGALGYVAGSILFILWIVFLAGW